MQKITPFLWFNNNVAEAVDFYLTVFKNSKILSTIPGPNGTIMGLTFDLDGQKFYALNGGPKFPFTEAISFFVNCTSQQEVDELWEKLSQGGKKDRCGWLKDKYGLSWQIIPSILGELMADSDPAKSKRVMEAMLKMDKINIEELQKAYEQNN